MDGESLAGGAAPDAAPGNGGMGRAGDALAGSAFAIPPVKAPAASMDDVLIIYFDNGQNPIFRDCFDKSGVRCLPWYKSDLTESCRHTLERLRVPVPRIDGLFHRYPKDDRYSLIVVFDTMVHPTYIERLKRIAPSAKIVFWGWNAVRGAGERLGTARGLDMIDSSNDSQRRREPNSSRKNSFSTEPKDSRTRVRRASTDASGCSDSKSASLHQFPWKKASSACRMICLPPTKYATPFCVLAHACRSAASRPFR